MATRQEPHAHTPRRSKSEPIEDPVQAAKHVEPHAAVVAAAQAANVADLFQYGATVHVQAGRPHCRRAVAATLGLAQPLELRAQVAFYGERAAPPLNSAPAACAHAVFLISSAVFSFQIICII